VREWLQEWVFGVRNRAEYAQKMGAQRWQQLKPGDSMAAAVNYGTYA
jgi:glutaconate CoA-transferase subunit A